MASLRHILALNIKEKRRSLGLSQVKLAAKVNTAPTYIAMLELEKRSPSLEMIERIGRALDTDPAELFSKAAYPVDIIRRFHESVLEGFEETLHSRIEEFEKGTYTRRLCGV